MTDRGIFFLISDLSRSIAVHGCFIFKGHNRSLWTIVFFGFFFYRLHMEVKQNMYLGRGDVVCGTCQERIFLNQVSATCFSSWFWRCLGSKLSFKFFLCHVTCFVFVPVIEFTLVTHRKPSDKKSVFWQVPLPLVWEWEMLIFVTSCSN